MQTALDALPTVGEQGDIVAAATGAGGTAAPLGASLDTVLTTLRNQMNALTPLLDCETGGRPLALSLPSGCSVHLMPRSLQGGGDGWLQGRR